MKTELENLLKELESEKSKANKDAQVCLRNKSLHLAGIAIGRELAFEFSIVEVTKILNDKRSVK